MVDIDGEVVELCKTPPARDAPGRVRRPADRVAARGRPGLPRESTPSASTSSRSTSSSRWRKARPACSSPRSSTRSCATGSRPAARMTMQAGMTKLGELGFFTAIHRTLREVFPVVAGYQTFISCFGTPWGFIVATKKVDPRRQDVADGRPAIAERIKGPLGYWDGADPSARLQPAQVHPQGHRRADPRRHRRAPADRHLRGASWPPSAASRVPSSLLPSASPRAGRGRWPRRSLAAAGASRACCAQFDVVPRRRLSRRAHRRPTPSPGWRSTRRARWRLGCGDGVVLGADTIVVVDGGRRSASRPDADDGPRPCSAGLRGRDARGDHRASPSSTPRPAAARSTAVVSRVLMARLRRRRDRGLRGDRRAARQGGRLRDPGTRRRRWWPGSSAPTPTSSGLPLEATPGCWPPSACRSAPRRRAEAPAQGLDVKHLLRRRHAARRRQGLCARIIVDRLADLVGGDEAVRQVERRAPSPAAPRTRRAGRPRCVGQPRGQLVGAWPSAMRCSAASTARAKAVSSRSRGRRSARAKTAALTVRRAERLRRRRPGVRRSASSSPGRRCEQAGGGGLVDEPDVDVAALDRADEARGCRGSRSTPARR